jgi:hypothetical protein
VRDGFADNQIVNCQFVVDTINHYFFNDQPTMRVEEGTANQVPNMHYLLGSMDRAMNILNMPTDLRLSRLSTHQIINKETVHKMCARMAGKEGFFLASGFGWGTFQSRRFATFRRDREFEIMTLSSGGVWTIVPTTNTNVLFGNTWRISNFTVADCFNNRFFLGGQSLRIHWLDNLSSTLGASWPMSWGAGSWGEGSLLQPGWPTNMNNNAIRIMDFASNGDVVVAVGIAPIVSSVTPQAPASNFFSDDNGSSWFPLRLRDSDLDINLVSDAYLRRVVYANGIFVAIGRLRFVDMTTIWVSHNGINWQVQNNFIPFEPQIIPMAAMWSDITYANGVWMMVGFSITATAGRHAVYAVSEDNAKSWHWRIFNSDPDLQFRPSRVTFGNGVWCVTNQVPPTRPSPPQSTVVITAAVSTDNGQNWFFHKTAWPTNEQGNQMLNIDLHNEIVFGNGLFLSTIKNTSTQMQHRFEFSSDTYYWNTIPTATKLIGTNDTYDQTAGRFTVYNIKFIRQGEQ